MLGGDNFRVFRGDKIQEGTIFNFTVFFTVSVTFEFGSEINSSSNVALGEMDLRAVALGTSAESFGKTFSFKFGMTFFSASSFECGGKI